MERIHLPERSERPACTAVQLRLDGRVSTCVNRLRTSREAGTASLSTTRNCESTTGAVEPYREADSGGKVRNHRLRRCGRGCVLYRHTRARRGSETQGNACLPRSPQTTIPTLRQAYRVEEVIARCQGSVTAVGSPRRCWRRSTPPTNPDKLLLVTRQSLTIPPPRLYPE